MQTITETAMTESWTRSSDRPWETSYSKSFETTTFWFDGNISLEEALRIMELHRLMREWARQALEFHERTCREAAQRAEMEKAAKAPTADLN